MGVGKSFWANQLSGILQFPVVDLDSMIAEQCEQTIVDIFNNQGEAYFRRIEHEVLKHVISLHSDVIIACGGGTPCFHQNKAIMKATGIIVFLTDLLPNIAHRIQQSKTETRPLLSTKHDVLTTLEELWIQRKACYEDCTLQIDVKQINPITFAQILTQYA